jgi:hypothetical protein
MSESGNLQHQLANIHAFVAAWHLPSFAFDRGFTEGPKVFITCIFQFGNVWNLLPFDWKIYWNNIL